MATAHLRTERQAITESDESARSARHNQRNSNVFWVATSFNSGKYDFSDLVVPCHSLPNIGSSRGCQLVQPEFGFESVRAILSADFTYFIHST